MGENPATTILHNLPPDCHPDTYLRWTQRALLIERDGNTCSLCGEPMPTQDMTIDHIIPRSRGGTDHPINLQLAHYDCNREKGNTPANPWFREIVEPVMQAEPWERGWRKLAAWA